MDAPADLLNPTPEEMIAALLDAARAERWNHWEHEVDAHARDWSKRREMRKPMNAAQFRALPEAVARYQFVELCVYRYRRRIVWGFYCRKLLFQGDWLTQVTVVLDPQKGEIIHCMRPDKGKKYCKDWGDQQREFYPVRW
jgi:hypothetical protein